mgnify:CR=1 FL=1
MIGRLALVLTACLLPLQGAGSEAARLFEIALERHEAGTFYVRGRLGEDLETELLRDTGSTYVALTKETLAAVRRQAEVVHVRDIEGTMAGGRTLRVPIYEVPLLELGASCVLRNVEGAVIPGATRNILGLSALRHLQPLTLSLEPPRLTFSRCPGMQQTAAAR